MATFTDLASLQNALGYNFKDPSLLAQAITHSSFAYESKHAPVPDNNRLEFFGDSILGMIVSDHLFRSYPDKPEGELTSLRSLVVNRNNLSRKAREMALGQYLRLGKGEEKTGGRENTTNLSGSLEAMVAAVYLDGGFEASREFVLRKIME
jgi:ribonuclease-3